MALAFRIALRFLSSNKGQTILISLGIAIGVAVQIFIGLLIQGLQSDLVDTTIGRTSQITIIDKDKKDIREYSSILEKIDGFDKRIIHLSSVLDRAVFIENEGNSRSVLMRGFDFAGAEGIYRVGESIISGEMPLNAGEVAIGKEISEEIGINIGDDISILNTEGNTDTLRVAGIFNFGVASLNSSWIISSRETVRQVYGLDDVVSAVEMQVSDVFAAKEIASMLSLKFDDTVTVLNWQDQNQELLSGLNGQSISSLMIQIFVLVAVVLGIASVLAISVIQKSKQIGILKAMGIKDRAASMIFLFQGVMLGTIGGVLGVLFGSGLLIMFTSFAKNPDGTPIINISFDPSFIILSGSIAVISAVVASLIPAGKSLKLSPIEVIRNG